MGLDKRFMKLAIKQARKNILSLAGGPFGACIVKDNKVIATTSNSVLKQDATCHAEMNAIRKASRKLKTFDLSGCEIYSTTEPCPMCFGAIHWAKIDSLIYGTKIVDAQKRGFNELFISCLVMKKKGKSKVKIIPGFLRKECLKVLKDWDKLDNKPAY